MSTLTLETVPPHQMNSFIEKQLIQSFIKLKIENPKMTKKSLCCECGCSINKMNQLLKKHGYVNMIQKRNNTQNRSNDSINVQDSEKRIKTVKSKSKDVNLEKGGVSEIEKEIDKDPRKSN